VKTRTGIPKETIVKLLHRLKRGLAPRLRLFFGAGGATFSEVCTLAWPITVGMLGETAIGLVDTKLVGGLGASALGGVGVAVTLMYLAYAIVFGLMRGVKVRTSHAVGEGRPEDGLQYMRAGVLLGLLAGCLTWLAARDVTWVLVRLGVDDSTISYARDFLAARTWGAPAICMLSALIQYRQGVGDTRTPMIAGLVGNVLNAFLAYGLIYGRFGLPALGVKGAGYGTAIAETIEVAIMVYVVAREMKAVRRSAARKTTLSVRQAMREVASLGVPTGLQFGLETLAFIAFTSILSGIGAAQIAAHQVAMAIIRVSFLPGLAVSEAASVLIGRALGRAAVDRTLGRAAVDRALGRRVLGEADRVAHASIFIAASFMTLCGVVFGLGGGVIARAFIDDAEVAGIVTRLLYVAAVFQTLDAVTIVLRGALRAAKDVRVIAFIGISVAWVCIPGAAYVLGLRCGLGALGGWIGFLAETTIAATLFWRRWSKGAWREAYASIPARVADVDPEIVDDEQGPPSRPAPIAA
jgi:MATE family multidrug resistance protein